MQNKNTELLGKTDVKKALIVLAIPATIGMLVNAFYNLVDSLFVGWGAGEIAIGGLTLAIPIQLIVMAVALMIGIGSASVFSRAYGRNDQDTMHSTVNTALRFGVIVAIIISVLGWLFIDQILAFFDATPDNIGFAKDYLSVIFIGVTFQTVSMILNNLTRAEGRAKVAMSAMIIGTGLNIILDPIFIFDWGFGLGVKGAAIATVISQFSSFSFILYKAFDKNSVLTITFESIFKMDKGALLDIIKIGLPTFVRNGVGAILSIIIIKMIATYAFETDRSTYIAIYGVIQRVTMFIFMPGFGLVQGLMPLAGYNYGAKNYQRLKDLVVFATKILTVYFIGGFLFVQLGATFIFRAFSNTDNIFFIETGAAIFRIITIGMVLTSYQIIAGSIYQSFGYAVRAFLISLSRQFILFIPFAFILTSLLGLTGLWYTFAISDILSGILGLVMVLYEIKVLQKLTLIKKDS